MTCTEVLDRLLEAEPAELARRGGSGVAAHVRACPRCAAVAARLLDGQEALAAALGANAPRGTPEEALERALGCQAVPGYGGHTPEKRPQAGWRRAAAILPLAAAATVAGLLVTGRETTPPRPLPVERLADRPAPAVGIPPGHDAAVFTTSNPKITVVWLY